LTGLVFATLLIADRTACVAASTDLVEATKARDRSAVFSLIRQRADVNATEPDGTTALQWAAHWDDLDVADALIRAGARIDAANLFGVTPLWLAGENGSPSMVETLLRAGANPNIALRSGETPLMVTVRTGHEGAVRLLLASGARVDAKEFTHGQTALMWAVAEGHAGTVRLLVEHGADVNIASKAGFSPLMFAARVGNVDVATQLLNRGADVNAVSADGSTPLLVATARGHVDVALAFLDRGANPNFEQAGFTPLHWACGVWESYFTHDYQLTDEWAAVRGIPNREEQLRLIHALIVHGANVNARLRTSPPRIGGPPFPEHRLGGATPLFLAALAADGEVIRLLHTAGADLTIRTDDKTTPLIGALGGFMRVDFISRISEADVLATVTQLIEEFKSDVNATNELGETALHMAVVSGLDRVVEYLVQKGASLTARTKPCSQSSVALASTSAGLCDGRLDSKTPLEAAAGFVVNSQIVVRPSTLALLKRLGAE
jgi:ankyrin repeat protein